MRTARRDFVTKHAAEIHLIILKNSPHMMADGLRGDAIRQSVQFAEEFADTRGMLKEES